DQAAVAALDECPGEGVVEAGGAVVLAAAEGDVGVGGVQGDPVEHDGVEVAVEVGPVDVARGVAVEPPDAAVVPVEQVAGGVEGDAVVIDVRAVAVGAGADGGPGGAAVGGHDDRVAARAAAGVDNARAGGIDGKGG